MKVSDRTAGVEYAIRDIITHARAYEKKNGKNVIYLNIGDPVQYDFPTPDHIKNALIKAVQSNENFYTASEGLPELRQAIVEKEKGKGFDVTENDVIVTNGVSEALDMTLASVVSPGDEILMPGPHYPPYASYAKFYGGKPVEFKIHPDGKPDIDDLKSKINSKTSAICLISPNNPTGEVFSLNDLKDIVDVASSQHENLYIICDEIYDKIRDNKSSEYHKGFGSAYYTPVLLVVYPNKYPVINKIVKYALEKMKLYPDYNSKSEWIAYKEIIPKILELAEKNHIFLWQMDWVWWHVYSTLDYEGLYNFITKIMDAKTTYQPIMIRTLLEKGTASKETIDEIIRLENPEKDKKFVSNEVYEVLIDKHKIVKVDENGYKLNLLQPLTPIEQDKLVKLCNQEIIRKREKQSQQLPLQQQPLNYWIFIVADQPKSKLSAEEIYQTRMNNKFWGLNEHTRYRKQLKKGDLVVFCHATKKFLGTAKLETNCFEPNEEQKMKN